MGLLSMSGMYTQLTLPLSPLTIACFLFISILSGYIFLSGFQTDQIILRSALGQNEPPTTIPEETVTVPTPGIPSEPGLLTPVVETTERPSSIVLLNIEWLKSAELAGDAAVQPDSIMINSIPLDEDCCYIIKYAPGPIGKVWSSL